MRKLCEGNMRRNLMVLTVGPLALFLAMMQVGSAMAVANTEQNRTTAALAASFPANRAGGQRTTLLLLPIQQITETAPAPALAPPSLGPTNSATTTVVPETNGTDELTDTIESVLTPTEEASPETDPITPTLTTVQLLTDTQESDLNAATVQENLDAAYALPIEGTIIANRTEANIRFFVEGATYELDSLRSIGLNLPRVTAVLNLYNCDAATPESTDGCFWDPYLLDRDGFYEIVPNNEIASVANLALQPAGSPPLNQIWLQNRSGKRETIFYQGEEISLPPAALQEFASAADVPAIFYLRSCLVLPDRTVCEWVPTDADPGIYYALEEMTIAGGLPNSEIVALELRPVLSEGGDPVETPVQVSCQLLVPTLNVRSGPGLEYQIVDKIRGTEQEPGRVTAVGRDAVGEWLAVDARIADGGWIIASPSFVECTGDLNQLAIAEVTDGRLAPTPEPVVAAPAVDAAEADEDATDEAAAEEATPVPEAAESLSLAEGQALIVINNGFDQEVRFTLDQRFRIEQGVSEYDLQPGESVSLLVFPGQVAFSVSSPWRGLSGNSEFFLDNKETRTLWLVFIPDPDGSGRWILQY